MREPTQRKRHLIEQATGMYRQAVAWYLERLPGGSTLGKKAVHGFYPEARETFCLNRASLQCAGLEAIGLVRAYRTNSRNGKASCPTSSRTHFQLRQDTYSIVPTATGYAVKFPTLAGRGHQVRLPLMPDEQAQERLQALCNESSVRQGSARIINHKGRWFLSVSLKIEVEQKQPSNVLGVDFGIVNLAVTSDGQFFSGRAVRFRKERLAKLRKTLQEKGRSSRAWKRQHKDERWMTHVNHCLSKALVQKAEAQDAAIALEELTGIRGRTKGSKRFNRMMSGWAFSELRRFIEYKAALAGVHVVLVDPRSSSRTCSRCGEQGKRNRADFKCACGFHLHSDLNAARNLRQRGIASLAGELETPLRPTASASG